MKKSSSLFPVMWRRTRMIMRAWSCADSKIFSPPAALMLMVRLERLPRNRRNVVSGITTKSILVLSQHRPHFLEGSDDRKLLIRNADHASQGTYPREKLLDGCRLPTTHTIALRFSSVSEKKRPCSTVRVSISDMLAV